MSTEDFNKKRNLLVIVNPFSGQKKAPSLIETYAKPILDVAHLKYKIIQTEGPEHATKIAQTLNLNEYTEIACCGGDGILNEVINGLIKRDDWQQAIKIPLCPVCIHVKFIIYRFHVVLLMLWQQWSAQKL